MTQQRSTSESLPAGKLAVIGSGTALRAVIDPLRAIGTQLEIWDDPYAAAAGMGEMGRGMRLGGVVLVLPCFYPAELDVIETARKLAPDAPILVAGGEGSPTLLASAIRRGIDGILIGATIEWLREPAELAAGEDGPADESEADDYNDGFRTNGSGHPLLSAEELRALLGEEPAA